jgi:hypothetical protein
MMIIAVLFAVVLGMVGVRLIPENLVLVPIVAPFVLCIFLAWYVAFQNKAVRLTPFRLFMWPWVDVTTPLKGSRALRALYLCAALAMGACVGLLIPAVANAASAEKADRVLVKKSESRLYLQRDGKTFASFKVAFGAEPTGHKQQEGDERTPEGRYVLDSKNDKSTFYKSIHISYPSAQDAAAAKARGVDAGGLIMVHGQKNGFGWLAPVMQWFNWTDGCIAVTNNEMDTIWNAVDAGTPIEIQP